MVGCIRLFHGEEPQFYSSCLLKVVIREAVGACGYASHRHLQDSEHDKAKELEKESNLILSLGASRVVAIAHRRDNCAHPVRAEDVNLPAVHAVEVLVCVLPRQLTRLIVDVSLAANIDPQA